MFNRNAHNGRHDTDEVKPPSMQPDRESKFDNVEKHKQLYKEFEKAQKISDCIFGDQYFCGYTIM